MASTIFGLAFTLATACLVIFGDTVLKVAADSGRGIGHPFVALGCGVYALSAICWFAAVGHVTLAQAGVAYSMLTLLALCLIGAIWFGEPVGPREGAGILCAVAAMILMWRIA